MQTGNSCSRGIGVIPRLSPKSNVSSSNAETSGSEEAWEARVTRLVNHILIDRAFLVTHLSNGAPRHRMKKR